MHPKFLAYLVVLCFQRKLPKQNFVARSKSKYLAHPKILGWLHYCFEVCCEFLFQTGPTRETSAHFFSPGKIALAYVCDPGCLFKDLRKLNSFNALYVWTDWLWTSLQACLVSSTKSRTNLVPNVFALTPATAALSLQGNCYQSKYLFGRWRLHWDCDKQRCFPSKAWKLTAQFPSWFDSWPRCSKFLAENWSCVSRSVPRELLRRCLLHNRHRTAHACKSASLQQLSYFSQQSEWCSSEEITKRLVENGENKNISGPFYYFYLQKILVISQFWELRSQGTLKASLTSFAQRPFLSGRYDLLKYEWQSSR